jgi:hypothetical protein
MDKSRLNVFDIEVFPNVFTLTIGNAATRKMLTFEVSDRKDQRNEMFDHFDLIKCQAGYCVGFNNVGFDWPVVQYILKNPDCSVLEIYHKAMSIIQSDDRFGHVIADKDCYLPQIDLYKIHHFDNKARATSLKLLEFNMRMDRIEEAPIEWGKTISSAEIDLLIKYNQHDVRATAKFLEISMEAIEFREELSRKYGKNILNFNDTKIGKDHFATELEKRNEGCCYKRVGGTRMIQQTMRDSIDLGECVFPYVEFKRPEFKAVLEWFKARTITETKGVFTDILESDLGDVAKYANMVVKKKKLTSEPDDAQKQQLQESYPLGWLEPTTLKSGKVSWYWNWRIAESLNVVIDGLEWVFGTGGIHASIESQYVYAADDWIIEDVDVASYYPNLSIKNRVYPQHLGDEFCDIYQDIYDERKRHPKKSALNLAMKLALNGTYGASNDQYSPMYDPKFTMTITVNGQLLLCMLAERLMEVDDLKVIMANTDGLTYVCPVANAEIAKRICEQWCDLTKLELESVKYSMMAIRDVNNYVAMYDGGVKTKGAFAYEGLGWHQNHSNLIIPMAAVKHITEGVDIDQFVRSHKDVFDFMSRTKVPRSSRLVLAHEDGSEDSLQNVCRYYVARGGGSLVKIMPPLDKPNIWYVYGNGEDEVTIQSTTDIKKWTKKGYSLVKEVDLPREDRRMSINKGQLVRPCNDMSQFKNDIDYDWYISEAKKLASLSADLTSEDEDA